MLRLFIALCIFSISLNFAFASIPLLDVVNIIYETASATAALSIIGLICFFTLPRIFFRRYRRLNYSHYYPLRKRQFTRNRSTTEISVVFISYFIILTNFQIFKQAVIAKGKYLFDTSLMTIDQKIFFGMHPWEITHYILKSEFSLIAIDFLYQATFFPMTLYSIIYFSVSQKALRLQFCIIYLLQVVIIGMILALLFKSAGPIFDGVVWGDGTNFRHLIAKLNSFEISSELTSTKAKTYLADAHGSGVFVIGGGISAMPSMHVAWAVLFAIFALRVNSWLGILAFVYVLIIWFGSIHLGWHYAVDGLVSVIATTIIWSFVDKVLQSRS